MTDMTPEQVLDAAAEYIHEHGWCRWRMIDPEGRVCLMGAIRFAGETAPHVVLKNPWPMGASRAKAVEATSRYARTLAEGVVSVSGWNDSECRDADQAIHALKKAKEFL